MAGYAISAQEKTAGAQTGGSSAAHSKMKPAILKGSPKNTGSTVNNKTMYKSSNGKK